MNARPPDPGLHWFAERGWRPFPFQRELWRAAVAGESGLLHAGTGTGKTYAAWFAAIRRGLLTVPPAGASLRVLWITPMRALTADTAAALQAPVADLVTRLRLTQPQVSKHLGVLREGRGRGVAKALLHASFARYAADGRAAVKLHVDADSPTGATHLYESVGMYRRLVGYDYHKHLGAR